jgi:hypothetical protein
LTANENIGVILALRVVIAEHLKLQVRDDLRQETVESVKRNEPAMMASRRCYKDQVLSNSKTRAKQTYFNKIRKI